jgi:outer membrane biosynthesis protein TonB
MRKWEDIVKDKLEEPDGALPESVFDEFHVRFDGAESARTARRFPLVWAMVPALAAGLAAVLLLKSPKAPEENIEPVRQAPVAQVLPADDTKAESQVDTPQIQPVSVKKASARPQSIAPESPSMGENQTEKPETPETPDRPQPTTKPSTENVVPETASPFIPMTEKARRVNLKVAPAAGGILGAGVLAALATHLGKVNKARWTNIQSPGTIPSIWDDKGDPGEGPGSSEEPVRDRLERSSHYFPIQVGLSARLPLSEQLYLSTGLQYSLYNSKFTMSQTGEKRQQVHYLGIPVRLDWVFASNSRFDVYAGGGIQGDFCLNATLAGMNLEKDRPSLSLVGAGGVQMNVTKHLGIYLEPELSWRIPTDDPKLGNNTLVTYRSEHPVMFSVATGIRINLGYYFSNFQR